MGSFSNISRQMTFWLIPIVSRYKSNRYGNRYKHQKKLGICFKFTTTDNSNFDKQCSSDHFVSFLFHNYCTRGSLVSIMYVKLLCRGWFLADCCLKLHAWKNKMREDSLAGDFWGETENGGRTKIKISLRFEFQI